MMKWTLINTANGLQVLPRSFPDRVTAEIAALMHGWPVVEVWEAAKILYVKWGAGNVNTECLQ